MFDLPVNALIVDPWLSDMISVPANIQLLVRTVDFRIEEHQEIKYSNPGGLIISIEPVYPVRENFTGPIFVIKDQIASFGLELYAPRNELGEVQFTDLTEVYDREVRLVVLDFAKENGIAVQEAVLMALPVPQLTTPVELASYRNLNLVDLLGGQIAGEARWARAKGFKVLGLGYNALKAEESAGQLKEFLMQLLQE